LTFRRKRREQQTVIEKKWGGMQKRPSLTGVMTNGVRRDRHDDDGAGKTGGL